MKTEEIIKQEIIYQINSKNNIWYALVATFGTTVLLLLNLDSLTKIIFFFSGIVMLIVLYLKYREKDKRLAYLMYTHQRRKRNGAFL